MQRNVGERSGRLIVAALVALSTGLLACRTPQSLCNEYFDERNAFEERCAPFITDRELICQEGNETNCGCGGVSTVEDPADIVQNCFQFFREYDCTEDRRGHLVDYPRNLPEACNHQTHFFYLDN